MMAVSETSVVVDGVHSPVLQAGPPDASEAVVFVHGNPGAGRDWSDLVAAVGEFARAVAPDMPGFGGADKPRSFTYTVDGYATHLGGLLAQLGVTRAHLVAHDFGGPWALAWAAANPDAFASATLVDTGVLVDYKWHSLAKIWRTPVLGEIFSATATRGAFRFIIRKQNPKLPMDAIDRLYAQNKPWATKRAILKLYRATDPSSFAFVKDVFRPLDRPALVIWGEADVYLPAEQAERQKLSFPSAQVEVLPGIGHWPMFEDPAAFAALVVPFLRTHAGSGD